MPESKIYIFMLGNIAGIQNIYIYVGDHCRNLKYIFVYIFRRHATGFSVTGNILPNSQYT